MYPFSIEVIRKIGLKYNRKLIFGVYIACHSTI